MPVPSDYRDPSIENPPTRPTVRLILMGLAVLCAGAILLNWAQVSAFAHIAQIEHAVGF
jgi:hypothetical protein